MRQLRVREFWESAWGKGKVEEVCFGLGGQQVTSVGGGVEVAENGGARLYLICGQGKHGGGDVLFRGSSVVRSREGGAGNGAGEQ